MVGFIASRSDSWFVCWYRSFGRIYGRWLACRLDCLLSSLSVGWTIRPACYIQPITDWPANHLSAINAWISGIEGLTPPRFRSAGWLRWSVAGQVWSVFHLASQGGIPSLLDRLSSDRSGKVKTGCVTCFAMPRISTYIFSCCIYSSQCFTYPYL